MRVEGEERVDEESWPMMVRQAAPYGTVRLQDDNAEDAGGVIGTQEADRYQGEAWRGDAVGATILPLTLNSQPSTISRVSFCRLVLDCRWRGMWLVSIWEPPIVR
jgi:hypothetical protein